MIILKQWKYLGISTFYKYYGWLKGIVNVSFCNLTKNMNVKGKFLNPKVLVIIQSIYFNMKDQINVLQLSHNEAIGDHLDKHCPPVMR